MFYSLHVLDFSLLAPLFVFLTLLFFLVIILMLYGSEEPEEPMSGVRCPACAEKGVETWVIPGKNCHVCGTSC